MKKLFLLFLLVSSSLVRTQTLMPIGPQVTSYSSMIRGYHFTAPVNFTMCGLRIPPDAPGAAGQLQEIRVVRFTAGAPPAFPALTNSFIQLFSSSGAASGATVACSIPVTAGDIIGIYGSVGSTCIDSYDGVAFATNILGSPTTLYRSGMQSCPWGGGAMNNIWSEVGYDIGRIEMYYNCCPSPTITATASPTSVCPGQPSTLTASGAGVGGTYTWAPAGGAGTPVVVTPTATTIYTVTGTTSLGCTGTETVQITVNPSPTITATPSPTAICVGQSANVTFAGASTYTTNPGNLIGSPIVLSPTITTTYTTTGTSLSGCTSTVAFQIIVNPLPVVTPGSNSPICSGGSLSLTVGAGSTYTWTGPNAFTSNVQNPVLANVTAVNAGVYTVSLTNASGCTASGTVNVVVNPQPVITPTNGGPYCAGATINLSVTAYNTYTWTGPNGFTSNAQNPSIINGQAVNAGVYTVTVTAVGGCMSTGTTTVVINALPSPTATSNSPVCTGQPINFTGAGGTTYTWTGPGGFTSNAQFPSIAVAQASNTGIYTLAVTNINGCVNTTTTNVIISALPVIAVNNPTVCLNQNIALTATGGTAYAWSGPLGYTSNQQNPVIANAQLNMSGAYTVTVTSAAGCTNTAVANVTVITLPNPVITSNAPVCVGATLNFTATGGATYSWSGPNGFASALQYPNIPNVTLAANGVYTLIATAGTCSNSTTANIVVNALPTPTATSNSPVCVNQPINFTGAGGTTYTWTGPGAFNTNVQNPSIASAQATNAGTYTLTVGDANSCTNSITTNVVVNPLPVIVVNNSTVCVGQNINLSATGGTAYAWSGPAGFVSGLQNPVIANAQTTMSGAYTVTVTSAAGCTNTAVANVTVMPLPTPAIVSNTPCVGAALTFTGSGGATYSWTGPNGFASAVQNPTVANVTMAANGVYTLIASAGTCSNSTTAIVVVNPLPTPTITSNSPVCLNQPINLTGAGGITYTWTGPGAYNSVVQNPTIALAQATNAGTYTLAITDVNGCSNSTTQIVVVNPLPVITAAGSTVCLNTAISLSSGGASTYTWSGPNTFTSNAQNPSIPVAALNMTGAYTVTGTSALGCTNTAVANVSVMALPNPAIVSNTPCVGATLSFTGTGGATYSWTGPNGFTSNQQNPSISNVSLTANGTYSLMVTSGTCSNNTTALVTINALPNATITSNSPVCLQQTIHFYTGGGSVYNWAGPNGYTGSGANLSIPSAGNTNAGTYTLSLTDANGCSNTATTSVMVNPLPIIAALGSTVCAAKTISLSATGGTAYAWVGPYGFTSTNAMEFIPNCVVSQQGQYTVTVTDINGCTSYSVTNVQINPIPSPTVGANSPICEHDTLSLQSSALTGVNFAWTGPNAFFSVEKNPKIGNATVLNAGMYTVTISDNIGCSATALVNMNINPLPVVTINSDKAKGCVPICVNFNPQSTSSLQSCVWDFGDGSTVAGLNVAKCFNTAGNFNISTRFTDINGCHNTSSYLVEAYPIPVADFNYASSKPIINEQVEFSDASYGATVAGWLWNFSHLPNYQAMTAQTTLSYENPGTYVVALIVTSNHGCKDTAVKSITIGEDFTVYVPDAFSPNGDGLNDVFQPKGFGIVKYELNVFDRWGERVFTSTDINQGWDGSFPRRKENEIKQDIYIWKMKITTSTSKEKELSGKVSIIR